MKYIVLIFALSSFSAQAEFFDPMQPPAFALYKYRLEKQEQQIRPDKVDQKPKVKPFVLNSILYSRARKHAIINNKIIKKGESIDGAKLIELSPDKVRLVKKGKVIDLSLNSGLKSIKTISAGNKL